VFDRPLPEYVDIRKAFLENEEVSGFVASEKLMNMRDILVGENARVKAILNFLKDKTGRRIITGELTATIEVACQRCLEPLELIIEDDISLIVVDDDESAQRLEKNYEGWVCTTHKLCLAELIEEQLILALPLVSVHSDSSCSQNALKYSFRLGDADYPKRAHSPFEVLKSLKKQSI
jgi:uncharacterized protein